MTCGASFSLEWRMFVNERPLFIGVTLYACRIGAGCQSGLLELKTAVRVVTITALHRPLEHLVVKRFVKVWLNFVVATDAEVGFADLQQVTSWEVGLLRVGFIHETDRFTNISIVNKRVWWVTIRTANVVTPMLAAPEIIPFLFARMTCQTSLGNLLGWFVLKRDDLRRIAFFRVGLSRTMTRLAACNFVFPTADFGEPGVRSMRKDFELVLVTVFASFAADVIVRYCRSARAIRGEAPDHS
jgi:hypothetical protein